MISPSTEKYDSPSETLRERGDKLKYYRQFPSLQEYVLVDNVTLIIAVFQNI
ncbi:MAG: hypothetical protein AB4080_16135 [Trichodesmium sp.]